MGNKEKANQIFSFLVYLSIDCGIILAGVGILVLPPVLSMLGAEAEMLE